MGQAEPLRRARNRQQLPQKPSITARNVTLAEAPPKSCVGIVDSLWGLKSNGTESYAKVQRHDRSTSESGQTAFVGKGPKGDHRLA
ncbi:MAG: hypothetical protein ACI89J_003478 [Hyphomicrobiaceae bacterium]|jgi:hypothetical protein